MAARKIRAPLVVYKKCNNGEHNNQPVVYLATMGGGLGGVILFPDFVSVHIAVAGIVVFVVLCSNFYPSGFG